MGPRNLLRSTVFRRTLTVVLLLAGVAAAVTGLVGWYANGILTQSSERAVEADAVELRAELMGRGLDALAQLVTEKSRSSGGGVYFLAGADGSARAGNLDRLPNWTGVPGRGVFTYSRGTGAAAHVRRAAGLLIEIDGEPRLVVGRDIEDQRALLLAIYRSIGLGTAVLILIGLGGSVLISRHIQSRIDAMSRASAGIMAGDLSGRIPSDASDDELDRLAHQLNDMLARIEQLMAGLREVSDNIAHDLKTPLNRLRNHAEAALGDGRGGDAWRNGLERVIDEADEIIKTFNALLLIARLEAGSTTDGFETLDLSRLVVDVAELYEPVAEETGFRLDCATDAGLVVLANRQLLGQALANLIDNALKYAAADRGLREITITARRQAGTARLEVADRGPGIAFDDRERALRRFVRLEQSRSLPGTGLGLSLVAAVARLHRGVVTLEDNEPGLRVVLALPLAIPAANVAELGEEKTSELETARG
jgi:signal transduction histidine kinase